MRISPRTLPGSLCPQNRGSADWSWQSMLAYGCRSLVVVLDPRTLQIVQTLDHQSGFINKVKWSPQTSAHTLGDPYTLRLAAADTTGRIIVWDVNQAAPRAEFVDASKSVVDMAWLGAQSGCRDLLAVIHGPSTLAVWNADSGVCCWKKTLTESILGLTLDPFNSARLALRASDCLLLINDFSATRAPPSAPLRFFTTVSAPLRTATPPMSATSGHFAQPSPRVDRRTKALSKVKQLVYTSARSVDSAEVPMSDCLQVIFHKSCRHHICLVYPKEILIIDLAVQQTVGSIVNERNSTPFVQLLPCQQRDILFCLHESGAISMRARQSYLDLNRVYSSGTECPGSPMSLSSVPEDMTYTVHCHSDTLRLSKATMVFAACTCPVDERSVSLVLSDGRVLIWDLLAAGPKTVPARMPPACVATPIEVTSASPTLDPERDGRLFPSMCLSDILPPQWASQTDSFASGTAGRVGSPMGSYDSVLSAPSAQVQFVLTGLAQAVMANTTCLRMCPPLTSKNLPTYQPLCAVGCSSGIVQVFNLATGQLARQYAVHTFPVKGVEWISQTSFISWAFSSPNSTGLVRNELITVDTVTGRSRVIRATLAGEGEAPLEGVKMSSMRQYLTVFLKDKPMEIWDVQSMTLLRQMKEKFPVATAMEWSPAKSRRPQQDKASLTEGSSSETKDAQVLVKEHLVMTDMESCLRHFIIEGSSIKEGSKIPAEGGIASVTTITWKGERIVLGDADGSFHIWDLKGKVSRSIPTHRGAVRKVRFGPGKGNQLIFIQYVDGVDIWDAVSMEVVCSFRAGKENPVADVDWVTSDKPIVAMADGSVRLFDTMLKKSSSPIAALDYDQPFFSPHTMTGKAALSLRACLQHQPWNQRYTLDSIDDADENTGLLDKLMEASTGTLPSDMKDFFPRAPLGTAQRCLLAARLFGDAWEVQFWEVALFYLMKARLRLKMAAVSMSPTVCVRLPQVDLISPGETATTRIASSQPGQHVECAFKLAPDATDLNLHLVASARPTPAGKLPASTTASPFVKRRWPDAKEPPPDFGIKLLDNLPAYLPSELLLDTHHDVTCEAALYQSYELKRLAVHDAKRSTYEQTKLCAINHILLGQTDRAVQILLETEADNENYLADCLRACLTASVRSSGAAQSTIKLVATNFIANERLDEGIRLLCLIHKSVDACRYLQTYGHWDQSVWLAKVSLSEDDYSEVIGRYADHLSSPSMNCKQHGAVLHLALENFCRVVELLLSMQHADIAACFIEALAEFGVLSGHKDMVAMVEQAFSEYAKSLHTLDMTKAALHYCSVSGSKGRSLASWIEQHE